METWMRRAQDEARERGRGQFGKGSRTHESEGHWPDDMFVFIKIIPAAMWAGERLGVVVDET